MANLRFNGQDHEREALDVIVATGGPRRFTVRPLQDQPPRPGHPITTAQCSVVPYLVKELTAQVINANGTGRTRSMLIAHDHLGARVVTVGENVLDITPDDADRCAHVTMFKVLGQQVPIGDTGGPDRIVAVIAYIECAQLPG